MSEEVKNTREARKIAPISSTQSETPQEKAWTSVVKSFNVFGLIGETYAKTLTYKIEAKRIEAENNRINKEAETNNHIADLQYNLKLTELLHRKAAVEEFFVTVREQLSYLHIERMDVLAMAKMVTSKSIEPGLDIEERRLFADMSKEIISTIPNFGDKANESLRTIISTLPNIQISGIIG